MNYNHLKIETPVGPLHLVSEKNKLAAVVFDNNWKDFVKDQKWPLVEKSDSVLKETQKQLSQYFGGKRTEFDLPLKLDGTQFQTTAWKSLLEIPFGTTITYGEQAKRIKNPKAVRAIGGANGRNKICIIIPCHRVIGQNGSLTGFGGGIEIKKQLLALEQNN